MIAAFKNRLSVAVNIRGRLEQSPAMTMLWAWMGSVALLLGVGVKVRSSIATLAFAVLCLLGLRWLAWQRLDAIGVYLGKAGLMARGFVLSLQMGLLFAAISAVAMAVPDLENLHLPWVLASGAAGVLMTWWLTGQSMNVNAERRRRRECDDDPQNDPHSD